MRKIPWVTILMMINDQGGKREGQDGGLATEEEELSMFGLR